jgi:hypothetical protein
LSQILIFFSNSLQRVAILDEIVGARLPKTVQTRWNFNIGTVNMVYEHRDTLIECTEKNIDASSQSSFINQATGLKQLIKDSNFIFWLNCFHKIMPMLIVSIMLFKQKILIQYKFKILLKNLK